MKILIAGLGSIGRRHLRNLLALGENDILLYRTRQSSLPDAELGAFPVVTDLSAALDQRPTAAIIANPTALHLRAMNMLFEGLKENGAMVIVPSSAVDTMNLGGLSGMVSLGQSQLKKGDNPPAD